MPVKYDALAEVELGRQEEAISLSPFQERVCAIPEEWNLALTGGRGGGKSYVMAILIMRHIVKYGDKARVLFVRTSHAGCEDFILILRELFGRVWGTAVRFNANSGIWQGFPAGGYIEINQMSGGTGGFAEYQKFQGRSYTMILVDELGQYPTDELPNLLRSNLRGAREVPKRMVVASNPCGIGHSFVYKKFVLRTTAWHPFDIDGEKWVTCPSTFEENPFIDRVKYKRDLEAACSFDTELLRAFRDGAWDVVRGGAYFAQCLDEKRVMFKAWTLPEGWTVGQFVNPKELLVRDVRTRDGIMLLPPDLEEWRFWIGLDWGYSAPAVCYLAAWSPGATVDGRYYPHGSVLLLDEVSTAREGQPHVGAELSVDDVSVLIRDMWRRWGLKGAPRGVADDACGIRNDAGVSILDNFARCRVMFQKCEKGSRISGWTHMREMLYNATLARIDKPGLYVSDRCGYWWETVPFLSRSQRHPEDLDGVCDHAADATRYTLIRRDYRGRTEEF